MLGTTNLDSLNSTGIRHHLVLKIYLDVSCSYMNALRMTCEFADVEYKITGGSHVAVVRLASTFELPQLPLSNCLSSPMKNVL